jgi:hypothetical protein
MRQTAKRSANLVRELFSLDGVTSGYILNLNGGPTGRVGNVIHPFDCPHLHRMTDPPRKLWSETVEGIEKWVQGQGGELDPDSPVCQYAASRAQ